MKTITVIFTVPSKVNTENTSSILRCALSEYVCKRGDAAEDLYADARAAARDVIYGVEAYVDATYAAADWLPDAREQAIEQLERRVRTAKALKSFVVESIVEDGE